MLTKLDAAGLLLLFLGILAIRSFFREHAALPPGPRRLPVIGNLLDFPRRNHGERFTVLAKKHGDLFSLNILGETIIVINSARIAKELLERRARKWSDRPVLPLVHMSQLDSWSTSMMPDTDGHRAQRRIADRYLRPGGLVPYRPMLQRRVNELLRSLVRRPNDFRSHFRYFLTGVIMSIAFGYNVKSEDDVYVTKTVALVEAAVDIISPTSSIVNVFPFLRHLPTWVPGMGKVRHVDAIRRLSRETQDGPFDFVRESIQNGTAEPSLSRDSLMANDDVEAPMQEDLEHAKHIAASLYGTGVDTTGIALTNLLLVLLLYPETQQRAQKELDSVVGRERLPTPEDRASLPYVEAICKELLRWRLVTQLGIAHYTREDDVYKGYFIPKGSTVFTNLWAMVHDPVQYPDPEAFRPERFLTSSGKFKEDPNLAVVFGFGRRVCPGRHLVDELLYMVVSSIISVCSVEKKKDDEGNEIPVSGQHDVDIVFSVPGPFQCSISPRDDKAAQLIQATEDVLLPVVT